MDSQGRPHLPFTGKKVPTLSERLKVRKSILFVYTDYISSTPFLCVDPSGPKLEVVRREMASVNIDILGTGELKWTGMGEFNSDGHYIYYCGQESLRGNGVATIVKQKSPKAVLGCKLKKDRMISLRFQGKSYSITVIQVYAPTSNAEEAEVE